MQINGEQYYQEISLLDVVKVLWQQKMMMVSMIFICVAASITYLYFTPSIYVASVNIAPPKQPDLKELNIPYFIHPEGMVFYTADMLYDVFSSNLVSDELKETFFNKIYFPSMPDQKKELSKELLYKSMIKDLDIKVDAKHKLYHISFRSHSPNRLESSIKELLDLTKKMTITELKNDAEYNIYVMKSSLKAKIDNLNRLNTITKNNLLSDLSAALVIAEKSGVKNLSPADYLTSYSDLFMLGSNVLKIKIEGLKNTKISPQLREKFIALEDDYKFYSELQFPFSTIKVYRYDGAIRVSEFPISPRRGLVLLAGLMLGVFFGAIAAFLIHAFKKKGRVDVPTVHHGQYEGSLVNS